MTIIVFDKCDGFAYADSRTSCEKSNKHFSVVSDDKDKLYRVGDTIIGLAGVISSINVFMKNLKKGKTTLFSKYSFSGISYDASKNEFHEYFTKNNHLYIYNTILFFACAIAENFDQTFVALLGFIVSFIYFQIPEYYVVKRTLPSNYNRFFTGSGTKAFLKYARDHNSFDAISKVCVDDKYCNSNIKKVDISGRYWNEDIH